MSMSRPSPLVLVALLLGAAYLAADTAQWRAGVVIAAVVLSFVSAGWNVGRRERRHVGRFVLVVGGPFAAFAWFTLMTANPPLRHTYAPGTPDSRSEIVLARGFYPSEIDRATGERFAWTQERTTLVIDSLAHRPVTLTVELRSAALAGGPDVPITVFMNNERVGELRPDPSNPAFQSLSLRLIPPDWGGTQTEVRLVAATFVPAKGDTRRLGTMIRSVVVDNTEAWSGFARRRSLLWLLPACAVLTAASASAVQRDRVRTRWWRVAGGATSLVGGGIAAAVALLLWRIGTIVPFWSLIWVAAALALAVAFVAAAVALLLMPFVYVATARFVDTLRARIRRTMRTQQTHHSRRNGLRYDLVAVFLVALTVRVLWLLLTPPWLAPDEPDHYTYVAHIVEQGRLPYPILPGLPGYPNEITTSASLTLVPKLSAGISNTAEPELAFFPVEHDYTSARDYRGSRVDRVSGDGARATTYPPLYYLLAAPFYRVAYDTPVLTRLYAVRFGSAVFGALAPVFGYLLAYEIRRSRLWGVVVGLGMALMPMLAFISASVNNDAILFPLCTALCWLLVRLWRQSRPVPGLMFTLGVVMGLTIVTKPTGFGVLLTVAALVLLHVVVQIWRARETVRAQAGGLALGVLGVLLVSGPWAIYRRLVVDVKPPTSSEGATAWLRGVFTSFSVSAADPTPVVAPPPPPMYSLSEYFAVISKHGPDHWQWLFVRSFWGTFGWLDEPMPAPSYVAIEIFIVIGLIGAVGVLLFQPRHRPGMLLALALVLGQTMFLFIGADYYEVFRRAGFELGLQGRYFFPILAPYLLLLLSGWHYLLGGRRVGLRLAPVAMCAVLLVAFGTILAAYYGVTFG